MRRPSRYDKNPHMPASIPSIANPALLRWARDSIGYDPVGAARKIGVPEDKVVAWESGDEAPTIAQLKKAAEAYKRPLGVFFLPQAPDDFDAMRDFRRLALEMVPWSPELHGEFRRAHLQREQALELAEIDDSPPRTSWRLTLEPDGDAEEVGAEIRSHLLGLTPIPLPAGTGTKYDHLNSWTAGLEEAGVLVMATQRGGVPVSEMRAFCAYFDLLPVIMVNGSDGPRGRLFSLLHEYAHLVLSTDGLCDTTTDPETSVPNRVLEARCNAIAASTLMPADLVRALPRVKEMRGKRPDLWDYGALREAAASFGVSAEAFLRRLATLGEIESRYYDSRREEFLQAYAREEARSSNGGDWYRTTVRDLGKWYVRRVVDAHRRRVIDSYTAATFLNAKVTQLPKLGQYAAATAEV